MNPKIQKLLLVLMIGWAVVSLTSCEGNDPIDPCLDEEPVTARFTIGEQITNRGGVDTVLVSDTVLFGNYNNVIFEASENYNTYSWKIGDDERIFTTKKVSLLFLEAVQDLPVRLIVTKNPSSCFPEDDGIDTLTQHFTAINWLDNPVVGDYEGYLESNPSDIFIVSVTKDYIAGGYEFNIANINKGCTALDYWSSGLHEDTGYKAISFSENPGGYLYQTCYDPIGWLFINELSDSVTIDFTTAGGINNSDPLIRVHDKFYGKRK